MEFISKTFVCSGPFYLIIIFIVVLIFVDKTFGEPPISFKVAFVNMEVPDFEYCANFTLESFDSSGCELVNSSCLFINLLLDHHRIQAVFFKNQSEGNIRSEIIKKRYKAMIVISANFTRSLTESLEEGESYLGGKNVTTKDSLNVDSVTIHDNSAITHQIKFLEGHIYSTYDKFMKRVAKKCHFHSSGPLKLVESMFEKNLPRGLKSARGIPFMMCCVLFFAATITVNWLMSERLSRVWERILFNGATSEEIVLSHLIMGIMVTFFNSLIIAMYASYHFSIKLYDSNIIMMMILVSVVSFNGLLAGMLISSFVDNSTLANLVTITIGQSMAFLSGIFWPIEGMQFLTMRLISSYTPEALAESIFIDLILKRYSWYHHAVLQKFGILSTINLVLFIVIIFSLRNKK